MAKVRIETTSGLRKLLKSEIPKFVRVLEQRRGNVQDVVTYNEVFNMLSTRELSANMLLAIQQEYAEKLSNDLEKLYSKVIRQSEMFLEGYLATTFSDKRDVLLAKYVLTRGATLVQKISTEQRTALQNVLYHFVVEEPKSYNELATYIRACVGLTPKQMEAVKRYGVEMAKELAGDKLEKAIYKYAQKLHEWRAETIARTEIAYTYEGATNRLIDEGLSKLGGDKQASTKRWLTAPDEMVCEICGAMDGKAVSFEGTFELPTGEEVEGPPAHPNCRCTLLYELSFEEVR